MMSAVLKVLRKHLEISIILLLKDLRVRYKASVLGYLWAILNPIAFACVYYFAFKVVMRIQVPNYAIYLLTGLFPWMWVTNSLIQSSMSLRNNSSIVKKVKLSVPLIPIASVIGELAHFLFSTPVLLAFVWFTLDGPFSGWGWQIPIMILVQFLMLAPLAVILAVICSYVRDVEYLLTIALSIIFFLTPIVYPIDLVPERFLGVYGLNPFVPLISCWRGIWLDGYFNMGDMYACLSVSALSLLAANLVWRRYSKRIAEVL